jgi:hypothetical protein
MRFEIFRIYHFDPDVCVSVFVQRLPQSIMRTRVGLEDILNNAD